MTGIPDDRVVGFGLASLVLLHLKSLRTKVKSL